MLLSGGASGRAAVPSGASTGEREALELRDGDKTRYGGKGVHEGGRARQRRDRGGGPGRRRARPGPARPDPDRARRHAEQGPPRRQRDPRRLARRLPRRGRGARGCRSTGTSAAPAAHVLPVPMMNVINGGAHADNRLDPQEFMVCPVGFATFAEALRAGVEVFHALKSILKKKGLSTGVGDEGGFAPDIASAREALDLLVVGDRGGRLQAGQGHRHRARPGRLRVLREGQVRSRAARRRRSPPIRWSRTGRRSFATIPIVSIEDGMGESDRKGWVALTKELVRAHPPRGRRRLRDQSGDPRRRNRRRDRQRAAREAQPGRHRDGDPRSRPARADERLQDGRFAPLRRDDATTRSRISRSPSTRG